MVKKLAIFGSTGSIGRNTLEVARENPELFRIQYLTANSSAELLCEQVREFRPAAVAVTNRGAYDMLRSQCNGTTEILFGEEALVELAGRADYDTLVSSLVGFAGLRPTIAAIESGRSIALANKETLVVAGELINALLAKHKVELVPIDSEHSAILQCIAGEPKDAIKKIILTASGGPFRGKTRGELQSVTVAEALNHPNWKMGNKITIDSATMMNKGLEVIEAKWLFDVEAEQIEVIVHPQSIIHSMVEFTDGSIKAQLGLPDMKVPIRYALTYPGRIEAEIPRMDFASTTLNFEAPDRETFRCLDLAYAALREGGTAPAALNAANEIAVQAFLEGEIRFMDIARVIEDTVGHFGSVRADSVDILIETDNTARAYATTRCAAA